MRYPARNKSQYNDFLALNKALRTGFFPAEKQLLSDI
jgi:hypothetical protein